MTIPRYNIALTEQQRSILERALKADSVMNNHCWHRYPDGSPCCAEELYVFLVGLPQPESLLTMTDRKIGSHYIGARAEAEDKTTMKEPRPQTIILHESSMASALNELFSMSVYVAVALVGTWIGNNWLTGVGMFMGGLFSFLWISSKHRSPRMTIEETRDFIDKIEAKWMERNQ